MYIYIYLYVYVVYIHHMYTYIYTHIFCVYTSIYVYTENGIHRSPKRHLYGLGSSSRQGLAAELLISYKPLEPRDLGFPYRGMYRVPLKGINRVATKGFDVI